MFRWIGAIIMTTAKSLTFSEILGLLTTGQIASNVVEEAADRAEDVADLLEKIEESIKEDQDDISM